MHLKFFLQCFRSAEREKDQDVQRSADIVPEMQKLDGSQEEENAELREGEMQSTWVHLILTDNQNNYN